MEAKAGPEPTCDGGSACRLNLHSTSPGASISIHPCLKQKPPWDVWLQIWRSLLGESYHPHPGELQSSGCPGDERVGGLRWGLAGVSDKAGAPS